LSRHSSHRRRHRLAAAIEYLTEIGLDDAAYEHELLRYATDALTTVAGLEMIGTAKRKPACCRSCWTRAPHDIGTILDRDGSPFAPAITARCR
jgi:cysteine desulfurase/selenocysteine lyase